ncbi:MAG: LysR family transcriptional regulator [Myxococcaceae bacterium]|nr:LysR family transcriptional regulator [Myxococcaceae bacterium]
MRYASLPFTLRQLQYVVAVAEHRSFRKAAQACAVSQPALSAQVAQLEQALGVRVFDRDSTHVQATVAGASFVEGARQVLAGAQALSGECQRGEDPLSGPIRLGVIPTVGPYLLPEVVGSLHLAFPRLRFTWVEDRTAALMRQLSEGHLDGAVVALESEDLGDVQSFVLGRDPFFLATSAQHELAAATSAVSPQVLAGQQVLVLAEGHCLGDQVAEVCDRAPGAELEVQTTSLSTLAQMVAGGTGVTLLPALAAGLENRTGSLHLRPFRPRAPGRTLALVWKKGAAGQAALRALAPTLRGAVSRLCGRS